MLEDPIFWIAIAVTVAGLVAVAVSIARGQNQDGLHLLHEIEVLENA